MVVALGQLDLVSHRLGRAEVEAAMGWDEQWLAVGRVDPCPPGPRHHLEDAEVLDANRTTAHQGTLHRAQQGIDDPGRFLFGQRAVAIVDPLDEKCLRPAAFPTSPHTTPGSDFQRSNE
jgi:hypothetical protein